MGGPWLGCAARLSTNLPPQVGIGKYRGIKVRIVGASRSCTKTGVRIQALCSTEQISEDDVQVCAPFECTSFCACFDRVAPFLFHTQEYSMVCRCCRGIGLIWPVDVCTDRLMEDVKMVELVDC